MLLILMLLIRYINVNLHYREVIHANFLLLILWFTCFQDGLSALHKAIIGKKQAITNYLLRNSANPFILDKVSNLHCTHPFYTST